MPTEKEVAAAIATLNSIDPMDLPDFLASCREIKPEVLGQIIMRHTDADADRLPPALREFWFKLALHIGPDYAQGLYHAAVFVTKVA